MNISPVVLLILPPRTAQLLLLMASSIPREGAWLNQKHSHNLEEHYS
jgi:hypothetical protein